MKFESEFDIGDKVYAAYGDKVVGPLTVGLVRVELIDSPGRPNEELFDNYKPQQNYKEEYMCVETGIGSGNYYNGKRLYDSWQGAENYINSNVLSAAED